MAKLNLNLIFLLIGPLSGVATLVVPPPSELLPLQAWHLVGLGLWMALWWFTECIPIPATALLPLVWMPLTHIQTEKAVAAHYSDPIIFLFLGGFLLAQAIQKAGLHQRIALKIVHLMGHSPNRLIGGFMIATAFLSMWINNTATTMLMYTVALSIMEYVKEPQEEAEIFARNLLLGIAYSASIGGVGTLVGTAPNALLAGFMRQNYGYTLTMASWLWVGIPFVILMLPFTWLVLTRRLTGAKVQRLFHARLSETKPWTQSEKLTLGIFSFVALGWLIGRPLAEKIGLPLTDSWIVMVGALMLFLLPAENKKTLLHWQEAERIPWGVLILFGGGLALADAFQTTGLAQFIGKSLETLGTVPLWVWIIGITTLTIFLTEITSNTATTATFLPIVSAAAVGIGYNPLLFAIPMTLSASCAFMLPVATPPNAIIFASGKVPLQKMTQVGILLNLYGIIVISAIARWGLGF
ncbi:MAG: SLC13 family permease [Bacteroidia bacterium]